jgi:predicted small lipoprotein YifL
MSRSQVEGFKPIRRLAMVSAMQTRFTRALAVIGVVMVAFSLAGCGRKAGLDLPPSAGAAPAETETKSLSPIAKPAKPQPAVVPDRKLPIDILLD